MAYEVNVAENVEVLEVYPDDEFDSPRIKPNEVVASLKNRFRQEVKEILEKALEWEGDQQIGAVRYERGVLERKDYRNGYRQRELSTSLGTVELRVPRGRKPLKFTVFEAYQRRWSELDELLLEAHIGGMSCRDVGERMAGLLGRSWSGATVAGLKKQLIDKLKSFKNQPLEDEYVALIVDGIYVRIRQCGKRKRPVVAVIGVRTDGKRELLAIKVCYSENSTEVEGILRQVKDRGVAGVNLQVVTIDGDNGLESAVLAVYGNVRIQDCVFHRINRLHQNAQGKKRGRRMMQEASEAFALTDPRAQRKALYAFCDRWREIEPEAIACFEI